MSFSYIIISVIWVFRKWFNLFIHQDSLYKDSLCKGKKSLCKDLRGFHTVLMMQPTASGIQVLTHVTVIQSGKEHPHCSVMIENGFIQEISTSPPTHLLLQRDDIQIIDGQDHLLSTGLVDAQINGALGCNFNHCTTRDLKATLKQLPKHGVTSILPTVITASLEDMLAAIQVIEEAMRQWEPTQCRIAGIHLEGPFLNPNYNGIHPKNLMPTDADAALLRQLISPNTKLVTVAPEQVVDHGFIPQLREQGISVFAGHTGANSPQMIDAIDQGLQGVTHLFNAMKPFHHRAPGVIGTALTHPALTVGLIVDGVHVYPEALRLAFHAKTPETMMLVSDAIHLAGTPEGTESTFAGQSVTHTQGKAVGPQGELAGAACLLADCVRNASQWHLSTFAQAIQMATETPAKLLKLEQVGALEAGMVADMVLWHKDNHDIMATWLQGQPVYHNHHYPLTGITNSSNALPA